MIMVDFDFKGFGGYYDRYEHPRYRDSLAQCVLADMIVRHALYKKFKTKSERVFREYDKVLLKEILEELGYDEDDLPTSD